jgi:hypothetical protein
VKNTNIRTPSKAKPNRKPVFGDPALELVYRSWQRNRERAPELALKVVEAYAQAHRLSVRDLLRRFAEAEAWEASQAPQAAQRPLEAPPGRGRVLHYPPSLRRPLRPFRGRRRCFSLCTSRTRFSVCNTL